MKLLNTAVIGAGAIHGCHVNALRQLPAAGFFPLDVLFLFQLHAKSPLLRPHPCAAAFLPIPFSAPCRCTGRLFSHSVVLR